MSKDWSGQKASDYMKETHKPMPPSPPIWSTRDENLFHSCPFLKNPKHIVFPMCSWKVGKEKRGSTSWRPTTLHWPPPLLPKPLIHLLTTYNPPLASPAPSKNHWPYLHCIIRFEILARLPSSSDILLFDRYSFFQLCKKPKPHLKFYLPKQQIRSIANKLSQIEKGFVIAM